MSENEVNISGWTSFGLVVFLLAVLILGLCFLAEKLDSYRDEQRDIACEEIGFQKFRVRGGFYFCSDDDGVYHYVELVNNSAWSFKTQVREISFVREIKDARVLCCPENGWRD